MSEDEQRKKDDLVRLDEAERRMVTGEVHPIQRRILELMAKHAAAMPPLPLPKK